MKMVSENRFSGKTYFYAIAHSREFIRIEHEQRMGMLGRRGRRGRHGGRGKIHKAGRRK